MPTVVCAELQTRPGNLSLCAYCYGQQYRSEGSTITYHGAFGNKNNSWVLNNHFYPTKSYSKWNMAGKTNLSASRSMQFLTGKSHLARRIFFFQMSSRKLWLMSLTWWMVISICELPTLYWRTLLLLILWHCTTNLIVPCFHDFMFLNNCWPQFSVWIYFKILFKT